MLLAAVSALSLVGCGDTGNSAVAFSSLDGPTRAAYAQQVRAAFAPGSAAVVATAEYTARDLSQHPRDAAVLRRLGYLRGSPGRYDFTAAARRVSRRCFAAGGACADFPVGRVAVDEIVSVRLHTIPFQTIRAVAIRLRLHTTPTTPLGKAMVGHTDMTCRFGDTTPAWSARATRTDGVLRIGLANQQGHEDTDVVSAAPDAVLKEDPSWSLQAPCPSFSGQFAPLSDE